MTVYAIAQLRFTDRTAYDKYQMRFMDVFRRYHGTLPAVDEAPLGRRGQLGSGKVVLMSFPDESEFRLWSESAEYQEISKDRDAGRTRWVLLVKGLA